MEIPYIIHGHLGCFYFFGIMNNATLKIHVEVSVWMYTFISLGIYLEVVLLGHNGNSTFNLLGNCQTVFQSGHAYNPTAIYEGSDFSTSLPTFVFLLSF